MLYIIGLGLNVKGISREGLEVIKKCSKIYLENYTVEFPYSLKELEKVVGKKIIELNRDEVESEKLVKEAKGKDIVLLIYGSPLFATTHMSLVNDCKKSRIKVKNIFSAGIFDALGETGLQLYKFGKISSMPKWEKSYEPYSFLEFVEQNQIIEAHSLILMDICLDFKDALEQLEKAVEKESYDIKIDKILVCSKLGSEKAKIFYGDVKKFKGIGKKIKAPFCFIIPGKMHFMEEEVVRGFGV